ncbi:MAG: 2-oxoadipate dioxygenase/decarboxylase family protein [Actinocrinis sp.]
MLDVDLLYQAVGERCSTMIDEIRGPPRWDGPEVLLRQTSFRALVSLFQPLSAHDRVTRRRDPGRRR